MRSGVSVGSIVRVEHALVQVATLAELVYGKPKENGHNHTLPNSLAHLVPHLIIKSVELLQSL